MVKPVLRQRQIGRGNRADIRIAQQRQDGMIKGRSGYLDGTVLRGRRMRRQNLAQHFPFALNDKALVLERIVPFLPHQRRNVLVFEKKFVKPRNLRKHLEIGEVLRLKEFLRPFRGVARAAETFPQLSIPRIASNQVDGVCLKQILQCESPLVQADVPCRTRGHIQKRILRASGDVVLDLRDQRRYQVEVLMNLREFVQQFDHSVVVLQCMQPHPGQTVFPRYQVLVKRLVLVPEKNYAQHGHGIRHSSPIGILLGILQSSMRRQRVRTCGPYSVVLVIPAILVTPTLVIPTPNGGGICDTTAPEERNPIYFMASVPGLSVHERTDRGRGCSDKDSSTAFGVGMTRSWKVGSFSGFYADQPSFLRDRPAFSGDQPVTRFRANHEPLQVGTLWADSLGRPAPEN